MPLLLGIGLRAALARGDLVISNDAATYLESGRNLIEGRGFERRDGRAELHFPPVTPVVTATAWKVTGDPLDAMRTTTVLFSSLALLPLAALARRLGGDPAGLAACTVGALVPALTSVPSNSGGGSEPIYLTVLLTLVWLVASIPDREGRARWVASVVAGATAGLLYLTRPEGILVVAAVLAVMVGCSGIIGQVRRREGTRRSFLVSVGPAVTVAVVFAACLAPYAWFLHHHTGQWRLTAKSQDVSIEAWQAVAEGDRLGRDRELYHLTADRTAFAATARPLTDLAADDPAVFRQIMATNVGVLRDTWFGLDRLDTLPAPVPRWALVPAPITLLAGWAAWRDRRRPEVLVLTGVIAAATITCLGFFVQTRYLITAAGAVVILAGVAFARLPRRAMAPVAAVAFALLALPVWAEARAEFGMFNRRQPVEQQVAGDWIDRNAADDARIMARNIVTELHADRVTVALPYASIDDTIAFARHHGVDYLVLDQWTMNLLRPQLRPLFSRDASWPGLRLAHEFRYDGRLTRIWALDPPPTSATPDPPGIGFVGDA